MEDSQEILIRPVSNLYTLKERRLYKCNPHECKAFAVILILPPTVSNQAITIRKFSPLQANNESVCLERC